MTKHLHRLAMATLLLGSALSSYADKVSQEEAQVIASEFLSARSGKSVDRLHLQPVAIGTQAPLYYVFNAENNGGFVIVSAESSATPVLGYSLDGNYNLSTAPDAFRWMMTGLEREIKVAPSEQQSRSTSELRSMARRAATVNNEAKLLPTANWSQEGPFNSMIPGKPLVGCVGTAMATVMKYHQHPAQGSGSYDGVDFGVAYDWGNMRTDNYRSGYTQAQGDAVAQLMYHASKSIDTQYAMSGSSAYEVRVPAALSSYFGYDPGVSYKKRAEVSSQAAWDRIVKNEIDEGRPVIYCGQDVTAGHAFVCDGYQGEYLHFNWGWGGSANGYFLSTALNPTVSRQHHYNNLNTIIYNIKPASGVITEWSPIHITADGNQPGIGSNHPDMGEGQKFELRVGNLKNLSYDNFSGKIAVALYSADGKMKSLLCSPANFNLQSMQTLYNGWVRFSSCQVPADVVTDGSDVIRIVTQAAGQSNWLPVAGELPTINELPLALSMSPTFGITFPENLSGATIEGNHTVIRGWDYTFTVTPADPANDVITVKANGYVLTSNANNLYTISNVCEDQTLNVIVQKAADVKAKRSVWVETPGTLSELIPEAETGTIKELSLFGTIDARDFAFIRTNMRPEVVDLSGILYIAAHGSDQANAIPREAFRGLGSLREAILPKNINRMNNGCFRQTGITTITIPAGVKTYEYNIFVSASRLKDIFVGRETAEFINWCVLSGVKVANATLHVPSERAVANYSKAENWKTIGNIIVDPIVESNLVTYAVDDNVDVMFDSQMLPGKVEKGTAVNFTCNYIPEDDNRMEVYANSTLLTPNAEGVYSTVVNGNTIIHFSTIAPTTIDSNKSPWTLTDKLGSVGMFSDAVNVLPNQDFTVRINALNVPQYSEQYFWAIALTDAKDNIKEFISPVVLWTAGVGDSFKMNVNCCVKEAKVREGNRLRLVTSANKRNWNVVRGSGEDIVDYLSALNNQTPVYNINLPEVSNATISGVPATAVHGRDITMKVIPSSAAYRVDLAINGQPIAKGASSINHTFVVKSDVEIDLKVYDPKSDGAVTYIAEPGMLYKAITAQNVASNVVIVGETWPSDLSTALQQSFVTTTVKKIDLSGLRIIANPNPTSDNDKKANYLPGELLCRSSAINSALPVVEEIILPSTVETMGAAFQNCANIKEIVLPASLRTLPEPYKTASGGTNYNPVIANYAFKGCTSLTTIYVSSVPEIYNGKPLVAQFFNGDLAYNGLGLTDPKKVTVVVPEEYFDIYNSYVASDNYNINRCYTNSWKAQGYNIVSEYPVYGVEFDPTHVTVADASVDVTRMASFLGDNIGLNSIVAEKRLRLANPQADCIVYDNGVQITPDAEGYITLEFLNPAKNVDATGNHTIDVVYTYDLAFNTTSELFTISEPEVINDIEYKSGAFDRTEPLSPMLHNVAENSVVRFGLDFSSEHADAIETHLMLAGQELTADADGLYTVEITNAGRTVEIFAVPTDGATLNANEIASLNADQTEGISSITLTGAISAEDLAQALDCMPTIEHLDLTDMEGEIKEGAFAGLSALTSISLPEVETIAANTFSGCTSLEAIEIPASVTTIGEGAFKDCKSLESIKLTGIESIGAGAFSGCDNLTSITLLADNTPKPAEAKGRRSAKAATSDKAFEGLNPNCFIILDEGVSLPVAHTNVLHTSSGLINETQPDGTVVEREGRLYSAKSNVEISLDYPLAIPHAFTLTNDASINLVADNEGWQGLVVPFDVESITDALGNEVEISIATGLDSRAKSSYLFTLEEGADEMSSVAKVEANRPYFFQAAEPGKYTFTAKQGKIAVNPVAISAEGKEYSLRSGYSNEELSASEVYVLNDKASAFVPAGSDDETVAIRPMEVYATSPAHVAEIQTNFPGTTDITGVDNIEYAYESLTVSTEGDNLVIYAPTAGNINVYDLAGRMLRSVHVEAGRNVINLNLTGAVIIADTKVVLTK